MIDITTIQLISALTGLIATIGGVLISYLSLRHTFKKDRYAIKLEVAKSIMGWPQLGTNKPKWTEEQFTFRVGNIGGKDFTIAQIGVEIGRRTGGLVIPIPFGTVQLPHVLSPGQTCDFWTEYKDLKKLIPKPKLYNKIRVRGYVRDYLGNMVYSNKMTFALKTSKLDDLWAKVMKAWTSLIKLLLP